MERLLIPLAMALFLLLALVLPLIRLYRQTGVFGIVVHRGAAPLQRFVGTAFAGTIAAYATAGGFIGAMGPEALGAWPRPVWAGPLGWVLFAGGLALMVIAQAQMGASWRIGIDDRPTGLVTHGLYRYLRNPIYTGVLSLTAGLGFLVPAWWSVLGPVLIYAQIRTQVCYEEQHMLKLHGDEFRRYTRVTGRFVPGFAQGVG